MNYVARSRFEAAPSLPEMTRDQLEAEVLRLRRLVSIYELRQARAAEVCAPHVIGSKTSRDAALSLTPESLSGDRARVYLELATSFGMTDEELARGLSMSPSTLRPRRVELVRAGLVYDSGRTKMSGSGRRMTVWKAAP